MVVGLVQNQLTRARIVFWPLLAIDLGVIGASVDAATRGLVMARGLGSVVTKATLRSK